MNQIIEITIDCKGEVTVQTKGFIGSSCRDASALIEKALGGSINEQLTAEFHQSVDANETLAQGQ